ncbi:MAG: hypothetical protein IJD78_09305 [Clostridia bacterium]|nr:hypothetical protein [Clostridia bacterium]
MIRKVLAVVIASTLTLSAIIPAYSADSDASVYSFYTDNMLFRQNEEAVIAGTAEKGSVITAELFDSGMNFAASGEAIADDNREFSVAFPAPEGSFEEYTVVIKADGKEIKTLKNVVFGELWLASGQSNMQYPLAQAINYAEAIEKYKSQSEKLRVLVTPDYSQLNDTKGQIPSQPLKDIPDSHWITGSDEHIGGVSAVAYFFANKMIEELDIPVGILNISLGGSTIASWISRKSVESNEQVKNDFITYGKYVELSDWDKEKRSIYYEMSTNYNLRIEALRHFRLSGMIWYQGETDIGWTGDAYSRAFDLLQRSYTDLFCYNDGLLPVVFTQLASYFYSEEGWELPSRNVDFSEMQQNEPDSRALISIYDIPLTYFPEVGVIHPGSKREVGERMAHSALGLLYDKDDTYTAATVVKSEIKESAIHVTFRNTGDGLMQSGEKLKGFSLCGEDGIYVKANAEITGSNTIRIWNEDIPSPLSAAYAYSVNNEKSNLYSSVNGAFAMPVSPFVTDRSIGTKYWSEKTWADCDDMQLWHTVDDLNSGFYPSWKSENSTVTIENSVLKTESADSTFSLSPVLSYEDGNKQTGFRDSDNDYSVFGRVSLCVKNSGSSPVTLECIRFIKNSYLWYSASVADTLTDSVVIPADNEWHKITFDLNRVYLNGNEFGISFSNSVLSEVNDIEFCFASEGGTSMLQIDEIRFLPSEEDPGIRFEADINAAKTVSDYISALFVNFIGMIVSVFR